MPTKFKEYFSERVKEISEKRMKALK